MRRRHLLFTLLVAQQVSGMQEAQSVAAGWVRPTQSPTRFPTTFPTGDIDISQFPTSYPTTLAPSQSPTVPTTENPTGPPTHWVDPDRLLPVFDDSSDVCTVKLYRHCFFTGYIGTFVIGDKYSNLAKSKPFYLDNDDVSSVQIHGKCAISVYDKAEYGGDSLTLTESDTCLIRYPHPRLHNKHNLNDRITSFKVHSLYVDPKDTGFGDIAPKTPRFSNFECHAVLYEKCHFQGRSRIMFPGHYSSLDAWSRSPMDRVSSVQVIGNCRIRLYEKQDFGGKEKTYMQNQDCVKPPNADDDDEFYTYRWNHNHIKGKYKDDKRFHDLMGSIRVHSVDFQQSHHAEVVRPSQPVIDSSASRNTYSIQFFMTDAATLTRTIYLILEGTNSQSTHSLSAVSDLSNQDFVASEDIGELTAVVIENTATSPVGLMTVNCPDGSTLQFVQDQSTMADPNKHTYHPVYKQIELNHLHQQHWDLKTEYVVDYMTGGLSGASSNSRVFIQFAGERSMTRFYPLGTQFDADTADQQSIFVQEQIGALVNVTVLIDGQDNWLCQDFLAVTVHGRTLQFDTMFWLDANPTANNEFYDSYRMQTVTVINQQTHKNREYTFQVVGQTGSCDECGTDSPVWIQFHGLKGSSNFYTLKHAPKEPFETFDQYDEEGNSKRVTWFAHRFSKGAPFTVTVQIHEDIGLLQKITLEAGGSDGWLLNKDIVVKTPNNKFVEFGTGFYIDLMPHNDATFVAFGKAYPVVAEVSLMPKQALAIEPTGTPTATPTAHPTPKQTELIPTISPTIVPTKSPTTTPTKMTVDEANLLIINYCHNKKVHACLASPTDATLGCTHSQEYDMCIPTAIKDEIDFIDTLAACHLKKQFRCASSQCTWSSEHELCLPNAVYSDLGYVWNGPKASEYLVDPVHGTEADVVAAVQATKGPYYTKRIAQCVPLNAGQCKLIDDRVCEYSDEFEMCLPHRTAREVAHMRSIQTCYQDTNDHTRCTGKCKFSQEYRMCVPAHIYAQIGYLYTDDPEAEEYLKGPISSEEYTLPTNITDEKEATGTESDFKVHIRELVDCHNKFEHECTGRCTHLKLYDMCVPTQLNKQVYLLQRLQSCYLKNAEQCTDQCMYSQENAVCVPRKVYEDMGYVVDGYLAEHYLANPKLESKEYTGQYEIEAAGLEHAQDCTSLSGIDCNGNRLCQWNQRMHVCVPVQVQDDLRFMHKVQTCHQSRDYCHTKPNCSFTKEYQLCVPSDIYDGIGYVWNTPLAEEYLKDPTAAEENDLKVSDYPVPTPAATAIPPNTSAPTPVPFMAPETPEAKKFCVPRVKDKEEDCHHISKMCLRRQSHSEENCLRSGLFCAYHEDAQQCLPAYLEKQFSQCKHMKCRYERKTPSSKGVIRVFHHHLEQHYQHRCIYHAEEDMKRYIVPADSPRLAACTCWCWGAKFRDEVDDVLGSGVSLFGR